MEHITAGIRAKELIACANCLAEKAWRCADQLPSSYEVKSHQDYKDYIERRDKWVNILYRMCGKLRKMADKLYEIQRLIDAELSQSYMLAQLLENGVEREDAEYIIDWFYSADTTKRQKLYKVARVPIAMLDGYQAREIVLWLKQSVCEHEFREIERGTYRSGMHEAKCKKCGKIIRWDTSD